MYALLLARNKNGVNLSFAPGRLSQNIFRKFESLESELQYRN
jgi:hypothetical protein